MCCVKLGPVLPQEFTFCFSSENREPLNVWANGFIPPEAVTPNFAVASFFKPELERWLISNELIL